MGRPKLSSNHCVDCGILIKCRTSYRCRQCFYKWFRGKNHSCYTVGKNYCIDCPIEIENRKAKRCHTCHHKFAVGVNASHYNSGFGKCFDCKVTLTRYGSKRCRPCHNKFVNGNATIILCKDCGKQISHGMRCKACFHKWNVGPNNPCYVHGRGYDEYSKEFSDIRPIILKRDDYKCQICGIENDEHLTIMRVGLSVHHIDYHKDNNCENNLISLCTSCHMKTNVNREFWQEKFQTQVLGIV